MRFLRQLWLHPATMLEERYWRLASNPPSEKTAIAHTGSAYQQWKLQGNLSSSVTFRHLTSMSKIKGNHRKIHYIVPPLPWQDTQVYLTLPLEKGMERKKQRLLETCRAEMPLGVHTLLPYVTVLCGAPTPACTMLQVLIFPLPLPPPAFFFMFTSE